MTERTSRHISAEDVQTILRDNPTILILDGLDEVTDPDLQSRMLNNIADFLQRCTQVLKANLQVLATSRPTGYSNQFDPTRFAHLNLINISPEKVKEYVNRWCAAKNLEEDKIKVLKSTIDECLFDPQIRLLMNTPLQVTILILIIQTGGIPPKQREALFNEYLDVIYKREKAKAKWIIQTDRELLFGLHGYLGYILHSSAARR